MKKSKSLAQDNVADSNVIFDSSSLDRIGSPEPSVDEKESTKSPAEESKGNSQHNNQALVPVRKKQTPKQEKIADGSSESKTDKPSNDKLKAHETHSHAEGIQPQTLSQIDMELKATAIEIFVRTLRINTDLLNGTHENNDYNDFLELLTVDDNEVIIKHLLSSKETTSGVAIHRIPHFFFHEYVFHKGKNIEDVFNLLIRLNRKKNEKLKRHVQKQLRKFSGLVTLNDTYHGIPIYFYIRYFKKDRVFSAKLGQPNLKMIPISDTGISAINYLAFETALEKANVPFTPDIDEDDYSEASNSVEADHSDDEYNYSEASNSMEANHSDDNKETADSHKMLKNPVGAPHKDNADNQKDLAPEVVITLYSLCRISDLQQILESYIDMWYDEEFKKQLKNSTDTFAKKRDAIVSRVAKFEESRNKRLNECQSFLNDMNHTNELASALNLLEHRLQTMHFIRKSRLRDLLQLKILAIRKEDFFENNKGRLVIYNAMFPNLPYLIKIREELIEENELNQLHLEVLRGEIAGLRDQRKDLQSEILSLKADNQRKLEKNESLERDNQTKLETIESLEQKNKELQKTIQRLQREMETGTGHSPRFFPERQGLGGETIDFLQHSKKDETPPKEEEKTSWLW